MSEYPRETIYALDALTYAGKIENVSELLNLPNLQFVNGNICDKDIVESVMSNCHSVVNFAAESHVDNSIKNPNIFVQTNVMGTQVLLEAARKFQIQKFIQVSTDEVYGSIEFGSWDENSQIAPNSPYSATKASADLLVLANYKTFGLPVIVTRCSNNYGPRQNTEKFIPRAISNLLSGLPIPIYGSGNNIRDWIHVDDHSKTLIRILEKGSPGKVYNISGGNEVSNLELSKILLGIAGLDDSYIEFVDDRPGHDFRYSLSQSKSLLDMGLGERMGLAVGLESTFKWYEKNTNWWKNNFHTF